MGFIVNQTTFTEKGYYEVDYIIVRLFSSFKRRLSRIFSVSFPSLFPSKKRVVVKEIRRIRDTENLQFLHKYCHIAKKRHDL